MIDAKRVGLLLMSAYVAVATAGCVGSQSGRIMAPLQYDRPKINPNTIVIQSDDSRRTTLESGAGPPPPLGHTITQAAGISAPPKLKGENIALNFEGIRVSAFANTVFGEIFKVPFEIDDAVAKKDQLVTMRTPEPLPPDQVYPIVTAVLSNYGISVVYQNNVYRIVESANVQQNIPTIIRARAVPSVPGDMRPIFYFVPLHNIVSSTMQIWLELALKDRVRPMGIPGANGLILMGKPDDVAAAVETITVLDQPYLAGNQSLKISPAFWSAQKLTAQLIEVLTAEGYSVGGGSASTSAIKLVPVEALNVIVVFSTSDDTLRHVLQWATDLDQPSQKIGTEGVYYYQVVNTNAQDLGDVVGKLMGEVITAAAGPAVGTPGGAAGTAAQMAAANAARTGVGSGGGGGGGGGGRQKIIVDKSHNAILFQGSAEEYAQFLSLAKQMDRAPLEVMIEATVAQVTLDQSEDLGIIFNYDDGLASRVNRTNTQSSDAGLFISLIRDSGRLSATLKSLASKNRVSVLSSPRIVATSGKSASMSVGTQVPIITTQQTAPGSVGGNSTLLQDVQYRDTGVILNITPTVNSSNRVELIISQEVSDAQPNQISNVSSPVILTRSFTTQLSLNDGEQVLLGGLISENYTTGDSGIPLLKDIPVVGNLFKSSGKSVNRNELIVLLTPYIIDGPETARAIRDAFRSQLNNIIPASPVMAPAPQTPPP